MKTHIDIKPLAVLRKHSSMVTLFTVFYLTLCMITYFGFLESEGLSQLDLSDFEAGKVSERDIVTTKEISYIDEEATRLRQEAKKRLVTPVFRYDGYISASMLDSYAAFVSFLGDTAKKTGKAPLFALEMQQEYPGLYDSSFLESVYDKIRLESIHTLSYDIFTELVTEGIVAFPEQGLEEFNTNSIETVKVEKDTIVRNEVAREALLTEESIADRISKSLLFQGKKTSAISAIHGLLKPFIQINYVFSQVESEAKVAEAVKQVAPIFVVLHKGQKIVRKGFIITKDAYRQLQALSESGGTVNAKLYLGSVSFLLLILLVSIYVFAFGILEKLPGVRNTILLLSVFSLLYLYVIIATRFIPDTNTLSFAVLIPAALMSMLVSVFMGRRTAFVMNVLFSMGVMSATAFQMVPSVFSLLSGISGVMVMKIAGKRIDLIKSACVLAAVNPVLAALLYLAQVDPSADLSAILSVSAINGFLSGIFLLGFLPILESLLNTSTNFRLMEFSDLNSPVMKKMLLSASGTYNHSILVATLAESACREIGADSLLARVGSYYHDIGKIEQNEYFVENQTNYNKHHDINPRLSATVIRSHVKQGVEKARQMRLPKEVIDIISEHHGNSVISYFYNEAKKGQETVDPEDFTYPGNPPRSKESAVVMLADVVEAACRTLDKPSVSRLEKFIDELIEAKIQAGQLDNSEITFRDIGIIKQVFVNILAGYYHSRIEYHNQKESLPRASVGQARKTRKNNEQSNNDTV